jgi:hypothetical protein
MANVNFGGFSDIAKAKAKALEIANGKAGEANDLIPFSDIKRPVQDALKDASAVGKRVDELTRLVR